MTTRPQMPFPTSRLALLAAVLATTASMIGCSALQPRQAISPTTPFEESIPATRVPAAPTLDFSGMPSPRPVATVDALSSLQPGDYLLTRTAGGIGILSSDGARLGFLATGAFINPSVSDDLQWIAFMGEDGRLSLVHLPGGILARAADASPDAFPAQWSPDGTSLLAEIADGPTDTSIGIFAVPSLDLAHMVDLDGSQYSPAWSPDGLSIAFVSDHLRFPQGDIFTLAGC